MLEKLVDIFLIFFLLTCGAGLFFVLQEFTKFSHTLDIMIAASGRTLSIVFYSFYAPEVRGNPWLVFEWVIPVITMAESRLILVVCGSLGDALCVWSTNPYFPYWYHITFILFIFDIITFLFLASLFDATRLGPFGALNLAIIAAVRSFAASLFQSYDSYDQTPLALPSRSFRWSFWTGRTRTSDPVIPLTVPDKVSPPPYTFHLKCAHG